MPRLGQTIDVIERIKAKTIIEDGCFRFTGKKTGRGYGNIWYNGKMVRIGRLICHLYHNSDLEDHSWVACHSNECKFTDCWNPMHLRPDTQFNNVQDQIAKGTFYYGTNNLNVKGGKYAKSK